MNSLDALLETISRAPATQIDSTIAQHVGKFKGANRELIASELKDVVEKVQAAKKAGKPLASEFGLWVLDNAWQVARTKT